MIPKLLKIADLMGAKLQKTVSLGFTSCRIKPYFAILVEIIKLYTYEECQNNLVNTFSCHFIHFTASGNQCPVIGPELAPVEGSGEQRSGIEG
jgi:hypothetical protein